MPLFFIQFVLSELQVPQKLEAPIIRISESHITNTALPARDDRQCDLCWHNPLTATRMHLDLVCTAATVDQIAPSSIYDNNSGISMTG